MVLENINMGSYVVLENVNEVRWHVVPIFFRETAQFITFLCTFDQNKKKCCPPPPRMENPAYVQGYIVLNLLLKNFKALNFKLLMCYL